MAEVTLLASAFFASFCGMAWFALAKPTHWQQARGTQPPAARTRRTLHGLGAAGLIASMVLCLWADHISMASLVWIMSLPAAVFLVTFTLAWRPRWLAWLVVWAR